MVPIKPIPDTKGLSVFRIMVWGSDLRWQQIDPQQYAYCHLLARVSNFPVNPTDRWVTVAIFPPNYFHCRPTNSNVLNEIRRRNLFPPDRAVAETTLDELKDELIVGVCGVQQRDTECRGMVISLVYQSREGRILTAHDLYHHTWDSTYQFVAIVREEMLEEEK